MQRNEITYLGQWKNTIVNLKDKVGAEKHKYARYI